MDRLIMKSEAALIIKGSAIFTVLTIILEIIYHLIQSHENLVLIVKLCQFAIIILFVLVFLSRENGNENDLELNPEDRSYETILLRLLVDFFFILVLSWVVVGVIGYSISQIVDELKNVQYPQSFISQLLKRPTPEEQDKKIVQDYLNRTGYFFRLILFLTYSFVLITIVRFLILLIHLVVKLISTLFNRNRNQ